MVSLLCFAYLGVALTILFSDPVLLCDIIKLGPKLPNPDEYVLLNFKFIIDLDRLASSLLPK